MICCVNKLNIDRLQPFADEMAALGVPQLRFTPILAHGRAKAEAGLALSGDELRKMLAFVAEQRASRNDMVVTVSEEGY